MRSSAARPISSPSPGRNERLVATVRSAAALRASKRATQHRAQPRGRARPPRPARCRCSASPPRCGGSTLIERAAPTDANVLILGENGTGKELVAREIHRQSRRSASRWSRSTSARSAESLFESELFGHVKGAFTDARADRIGRLQAAHWRHIVPRRDRQSAAAPPAQIADRARAARGDAGRRQPPGADRHPGGQRRPTCRPTGWRTRTCSARTCCSASTRSRSSCRRCAIGATTSRCCSNIISRFYERKYGTPRRTLGPDVIAALSNYDWPGNVRACATRPSVRSSWPRGALPSRRFSAAAPAAPTCSVPRLSRRPVTTSISTAPSGRWSSVRCRSTLQHLARRSRARPDPRFALPANGKTWALTASSTSA